MFHMEPVTESTFDAVVDMKLPDEQYRFVAPNVVSLAEAWLHAAHARPYALCEDDEPVGFMMFDWDEEARTLGIWRFMIALEMQHKGYGRKALEAAISLARKEGKFDRVRLDYVPGNEIAHKLYCALGFRETGEIEDGEIVMELPLGGVRDA